MTNHHLFESKQIDESKIKWETLNSKDARCKPHIIYTKKSCIHLAYKNYVRLKCGPHRYFLHIHIIKKNNKNITKKKKKKQTNKQNKIENCNKL